MYSWPKNYQRIKCLQAEPEPLDVWLSTDLQDPLWDDFLRSTPCGQYQQSGMWAEYKAGEGWQHHRVIITDATKIIGGFQILWKKKSFTRVGYVSKGPVVCPETPSRVQIIKKLLCEATRQLKLIALIAQDPDEAKLVTGTSEALGFIASNPTQVIETTYLVDVSGGIETMHRRMHKSIPKNMQKAQKLGVMIREGKENDLPHFFSLMSTACARKKTAPNPDSTEAFCRLWRAFSPTRSIRLTFAECEGMTPAGQMCLIFGNRISLWKKGWDGSHPNWKTATLLEGNALEWAHNYGSKVCDFCGISRLTALHMQEGRTIAEGTVPPDDEFKLRYGGYPQILPSAYIYFPNLFLRCYYRVLYPYFEKYRSRACKPKIKAQQAKIAVNV